jgi:hypothetical protein
MHAIWTDRSGRSDVRPVYDAQGVTLYTTKEDADQGRVIFSDTVEHWRRRLRSEGASLYPGTEAGS